MRAGLSDPQRSPGACDSLRGGMGSLDPDGLWGRECPLRTRDSPQHLLLLWRMSWGARAVAVAGGAGSGRRCESLALPCWAPEAQSVLGGWVVTSVLTCALGLLQSPEVPFLRTMEQPPQGLQGPPGPQFQPQVRAPGPAGTQLGGKAGTCGFPEEGQRPVPSECPS